jgi:hypothetical protein
MPFISAVGADPVPDNLTDSFLGRSDQSNHTAAYVLPNRLTFPKYKNNIL